MIDDHHVCTLHTAVTTFKNPINLCFKNCQTLIILKKVVPCR